MKVLKSFFEFDLTNNSAIMPSEKNWIDKNTKRIPKKNKGLKRLNPGVCP